jgi:hypothetical protein
MPQDLQKHSQNIRPPSALILIRDPAILFSGLLLNPPGATAIRPSPNGIANILAHCSSPNETRNSHRSTPTTILPC